MAGCVPCFVIPLLLFIFHRYIQPILLKFWNPWQEKAKDKGQIDGKKDNCTFKCDCTWNKKLEPVEIIEKDDETAKLKTS